MLYGVEDWPQTLVPQASYDGFRLCVQNLLEFHEDLSFLYVQDEQQPTDKRPSLQLCSLAYDHDAYKYSDIAHVADYKISSVNPMTTISSFSQQTASLVSQVAWAGHCGITSSKNNFSPYGYLMSCSSVSGPKPLGSQISEWKSALYLKY